MVAEGASKRDFVDAIGGAQALTTAALADAKTRFRKLLGKLLAHAQDQGHVRVDVRPADLTALVRGVLAADDEKMRARLLAIVIAGLRPAR